MKKINYKSSSIYIVLLNIYRFRHCFKNIGQEFGFFDMFHLCFWNLLGKRDKVIFLKRLNLFVKPNFFVITTLIEIFNKKLYENLHGLNCVLDLGAYIGESSLYLGKYNNSIVSFEPSRQKFELLEKNIAQYYNITGYNFAVIADEDRKEMIFHERDSFDFCSSSNSQQKLDKKVTVMCKGIMSVMNQYEFDGLKMDIEGGEYEIIDVLMAKNTFTFKKGVIEFHFTGNDVQMRIQKFHQFYEYLSKNHYTIHIFDNDNLPLGIESLGEKVSCLNLEFIKK